MKKFIIELIQNPLGILLGSLAIGICIFYISHSFIEDQTSPLAKSIGGVATAILTAGTFGVIFEYFNKNKLINESIGRAIGQYKAVKIGVTDFSLSASGLNYGHDIINSSVFEVGVRYSPSLLDRHREDIVNRIYSGKSIKILYMNKPEVFPRTKEIIRTPEDFFNELKQFNEKFTDNVEIIKTESLLCYNFVRVDGGIWIKMYLNSKQQNVPPAFFVSTGTELYEVFKNDIDLLYSNGEAVSC